MRNEKEAKIKTGIMLNEFDHYINSCINEPRITKPYSRIDLTIDLLIFIRKKG